MSRTLADWLIAKFPTAKRQTLRRMVENGRVQVNGRTARRYNEPLQDGDDVAVADAAVATAAPAPKPGSKLQIIFEDADLLVLNKPAGLLTSTVPREPRPTLLAMVREYIADQSDPQARVGLIHRLDREAAGLLVFSKSDVAYQSLKTQFFHHTVQRIYHAVVHGVPRPPAGRVESHLVERIDGSVHSTRQIGKGELAITHYETVETSKGRSILRVKLETGRKHQIRVHLSEKGCPIVGDRMYGPKESGHQPQLLLMATHLGFVHPRTEQKLAFDLELPAAFRKAIGESAQSDEGT